MKPIYFTSILALFYCLVVRGQQNPYTSSRLDIANNNDYSSFYLLDSVVDRYNVFFSGENHQFRASNAKLELKLLKYLHKKSGVNHLLLEFGYTSGYLVNRYVNYNDSAAYRILKAYFADTYMWLFKQVKEYNSTLDSASRIHVHGIDFEDNMYFTVKTLLKIMPEKEAPSEIGLQIETLRNMDVRYSKGVNTIYNTLGSGIYGNYYQADNTMREVLENYDNNKFIYDTYFEGNTAVMTDVMEHVRYYLEWREYITTGKMQERPYRERYMFSNFLKLTEKFPGEKFFGQFGRCHTSFNKTDEECDVSYYNSLVGKINTYNNDYLKNKVCVIAGIYPRLEFNLYKLQSYEVLQKMRKEAADTGITLFPVLNDTVHFGDLYKHYRFVFINNNLPAREYEISSEPEKKKSRTNASYYDVFVGPAYRLHLYGVNTSRLNLFYANFGLKEPSSPLIMHGISLTVFDNLMGNWVEAGYSWLPDKISPTSDTSELALTASAYHLRFGKDLLILSPLTNLIPAIGLGYNEIKMRHSVNSNGALFQNENVPGEIVYKNPAFMLDFSLHFSTHFYLLGVSAYGGYQVDVSNKKWRLNGSTSGLAPSMSLSGWYAGVSLGLYIFG